LLWLLLVWLLLWRLLWLDYGPGCLTGLQSRTKPSSASWRRLARDRRDSWPGLWKSRRGRRWSRARWRCGRLSTSGVNGWKIMRRQAQGARGDEDQQFGLLNVGRIFSC
jgi:hypothetical protein